VSTLNLLLCDQPSRRPIIAGNIDKGIVMLDMVGEAVDRLITI